MQINKRLKRVVKMLCWTAGITAFLILFGNLAIWTVASKAKREFAKGNYAGAISYYTALGKMFPSEYELNYVMATCYHELREYKKEWQYLAKCKEIDSTRFVTDPTVHKMAGEVYMAMNKNSNAIMGFTKSIELDSLNSLTYIERANAYSAVGLFDSALSDYDKAISISPTNHDAYRDKGFCYSLMKDYGNAVRNYQTAISKDSSDLNAYALMAMSYERLSDSSSAIKIYKYLLSKGFGSRDSITKRIARLQ